jgi:hypothetical protein
MQNILFFPLPVNGAREGAKSRERGLAAAQKVWEGEINTDVCKIKS